MSIVQKSQATVFQQFLVDVYAYACAITAVYINLSISLYSTTNKHSFCAVAMWLNGKVDATAAATA